MVVLLLAVAVVPRVLTADGFATIDEHEWLVRSLNFQHALSRRDFDATYRSEHPGVTTMWVGALGHAVACPSCTEPSEVSSGDYVAYLEAHDTAPRLVLGACRVVMVCANAAIMIAAYALLARLLTRQVAALGVALVALDPFTAAHTQLLHLDGLLACLLLLSLAAFLRYLQTPQGRWLLMSAAAAGLAAATKSTAIFAAAGIAALAVVDAARSLHPWAALRRTVAALGLWGGVALVVFVAVWPAMWVAPLATLTRMATEALSYAELGHESPVLYAGRILSDGRVGLSFYPTLYLWRSSPVVLVGLLVALFRCIRQRRCGLASLPAGLYLALFAICYALVLSAPYKKFDRYLLPACLPLMIVAAEGWSYLARGLGSACSGLRGRRLSGLLLAAVVMLQGLGLAQAYPYYLSYYNPALGGLRRAATQITVGWGEGLDQAAAYLRERPGADELQVASWYGPCFAYYFPGNTSNISNLDDIGVWERDHLLSGDYIVIYINQWQRNIPRSLMDRIRELEPEHYVHVGGVPYVAIYRLR